MLLGLFQFCAHLFPFRRKINLLAWRSKAERKMEKHAKKTKRLWDVQTKMLKLKSFQELLNIVMF